MSTATTAPAAPSAEGENEEEGQAKSGLGRALDVAGIVAAGFLAVIVFDVVSGGKVTRFVQRRITARRGGGGEPCEGCGGTGQAPAPPAAEVIDEH